MDAEVFWQITITAATALAGSFLGSKITLARLEEKVLHQREEIGRIQKQLDEHEGTITSHSIQLAVLDNSSRKCL